MHIHPFGYPILFSLYTGRLFLSVSGCSSSPVSSRGTDPTGGSPYPGSPHHSDRVFLVIQCPWLRPTHHPRTLQIPFYSAAFELYRGSMP